jgi:hypothetical protein
MAQVITEPEVRQNMPATTSPGAAGALPELRRRRAKLHAKQSMAMAILGENKRPGLLLRVLDAMGKAVDRDPDGKDMAMHLDVADRCLRALPWLLEKEGEAAESMGNALAAALRGGGPVQIVFGQHFHGRGDQPLTAMPQPGQPVTGSSPADAGAMPEAGPSLAPGDPA